ncbi:hypothetical protein LTR36_001485 [Oleoguttula mirabilis]|uniref:2EXR domain-containing protein n=1 Tax=Oleoguttula mirabilis TaxID=1507867 RepID=A0AAV9JN21_9PEZI|nr:hypothetical protein LTR36_001485 [Oleoguttula mirabilis]
MAEAIASEPSTAWNGNCRLLELPPELRNHIYELALPTVARWSAIEKYTESDLPNHQPALTRVSRQIRAEALPLYYHNLTVELLVSSDYDALDDCEAWLEATGDKYTLLKRFEAKRKVDLDSLFVLQWPSVAARFEIANSYAGTAEEQAGRWVQRYVNREESEKALETLNNAVGSGSSGLPELIAVIATLFWIQLDDD